MIQISVQNVAKQFGTQHVLRDVSLELNSGEVVGLIGANGSGKTTLFRILSGQMTQDRGTVTRSKGVQVGLLSQEPNITATNTLYAEVRSGVADLLAQEHTLHELAERISDQHDAPNAEQLLARYDRMHAEFSAAGGYTIETRIGEVMSGLGFTAADQLQPVSVLSGGQKCRAALAKLLLADSQLLLLDEPTNHLDIDAVDWLERYLSSYRGGVLLVSHDRYLLDRLADRIIDLERGRVKSYRGDYTKYVQAKEVNALTQQRQYENDKDFIEKERAFIAKHLAGQRTKEAQGRRTRLERRIADGEFVLEPPPPPKSSVKLPFDPNIPAGSQILRASDLAKAYGERKLFDGVRLDVDAGQRLGITGPNGTGKTTLLKMLLGEVTPDAGTIEWHSKSSIGYYAQEAVALDPKLNVLETIRAVQPTWSEERTRSFLGAFHFRGDEVFKPVEALSGGEQSRVRLIQLVLSNPDVLVLDEPTNHLDIASREALENALQQYPGTIICVSHDRYFLDRVVTDLLVMRLEGHRRISGGYSDYLRVLEAERAKAAGQVEPKKSGQKGSKEGDGRAASNQKGATVQSLAPNPMAKEMAKYDRHSVDDLEVLLMEYEQRVTELNERFGDPDVYKDPDKLADLEEELETLKHEMQVIEAAWAERVEAA